MSVQKLVAEADKLFEKGKVPEGIAKLKAALSEEPLNQLVATKLAGIHVQNSDPLEAARVFGGLAKRLSDAGKSSVAIAIYKQALELAPDDVTLRFRYAVECEAVGKLGDAFLQGQIVLNYYMRRKKYFDASNVLPLMARAQPKDDKLKGAWIEVMQLCQADQKLVNLLVALCGPPGILAADFPVGGDPAMLSPALYESLKKLVPYFPRDAKIAYAVAWAAYRRGRKAEMFQFLHECLRREPDFCLAILLFARVLAEDQRLNEALFLYRYFKERMAADKSADLLTLNRLLEAFVEKNGWIKFTEDAGDLLDAAGFIKAMTGVEKASLTEEEQVEEQRVEKEKTREIDALGLPPAEIEIGGIGGAADPLVILTATGQSIEEASKQKKAASSALSDPMRMQAELIKATVEAAVAGLGGGSPQQAMIQPVMLPVIQAAAVQGISDSNTLGTMVQPIAPKPTDGKEMPAATPSKEVPTAKVVAPPPSPVAEEGTGALEGFKGESVEFTSLIKMKPESLAEVAESETSGSLPIEAPTHEVEQAAVLAGSEVGLVPPPSGADPNADDSEEEEEAATPKKKLFNPLEQAILPGSAESQEGLKLESREERTQMFSPMEVIDAVHVMQNREIGNVDTKKITQETPVPTEDVPLAMEEVPLEADNPKWRALEVTGERTVAFTPVEAVQAATDSRRPRDSAIPIPVVTKNSEPAAPLFAGSDAGDATVVTKLPDPGVRLEPNTISLAAHTKTPAAAIDPSTPEADASGAEDGPAFVPIPAAAGADKPGAGEAKIDLGDDLIEGPTRIFTPQISSDSTEHLLKEIKQDLKHAPGDHRNVEMLMKKAERFIAKRNYYLARKTLRHAQALGADEAVVKERLREIRKLELPEGLYNNMSTDQAISKVDTSEVLERLELEFDLTEGSADSAELSAIVDRRIDAILRDNDPRTILDFGVGLHEMGLFRQAESLFMRVVEEYPGHAFDAYYLAATSKLARRDYAGAASILKRLSSDTGKTDLEKIQIYYSLGETFEKMRQLDRSKKFFQKVAELDANYRNIRHKLDG